MTEPKLEPKPECAPQDPYKLCQHADTLRWHLARLVPDALGRPYAAVAIDVHDPIAKLLDAARAEGEAAGKRTMMVLGHGPILGVGVTATQAAIAALSPTEEVRLLEHYSQARDETWDSDVVTSAERWYVRGRVVPGGYVVQAVRRLHAPPF